MRSYYTTAFLFLIGLALTNVAAAQSVKVGVFDMDLMVQMMPAYHGVDSLVEVYQRDSLAPEYEIYQSEYIRLDSTCKVDSGLVANGKMSKKVLDYVSEQRQKMAMNLYYWEQISQNKLNNKRNQLAMPIYEQVALAYKRVLDKKKYTIVLKPRTYEFGFHIENIFVSVAKELKLPKLPAEIMALGEVPDEPVLVPQKKQ